MLLFLRRKKKIINFISRQTLLKFLSHVDFVEITGQKLKQKLIDKIKIKSKCQQVSCSFLLVILIILVILFSPKKP